MKSKVVNYWLIWNAFGYLEIAEAEKGCPLDINPNDESSSKRAFNQYVRPEVQKWSVKFIDSLRLSFAYFINRPEILEYRILANIPDLTMAEPSDIQIFFLWFWESLFPGENIERVDVSGVREDNDVMQVNPDSSNS